MHDWITAFAVTHPLAGQWLHNMFHDLTRYAVFAFGVWLALWVILALPLRGRKIRADRPPARQMVVEFGASLRSVAIFSTLGLLTFALDRAGLLPGPTLAESWGPGWFVASLALIIAAHDAYFYWVHRLMHDPRLFRRFHRRHHRSMNPTPFTAYSFDLGEAAIMGSFVPLWMILVPTPWPVVGLFMLHQIVRNTLGHAGYELMPARADGRPMFDTLTTTTHHDLHHAQAGYNYGLYFTWWDRLMGTEHPEYHARFAAAVRKPLAPVANAAAAKLAALALAGVLALAAAPAPARAETPQTIAGDWATPGLGSVVRLAPCVAAPEQLCGRLVWAWDPARLRPGAVGAAMLREAVWRDGAFRDGVLANPEDGRTYRGEIRPEGDLLRLKGCAGPFCQTQVWRRLSSIPRP
jgi:sterol desaturase/sphingolipid hydroxylase (fatty acid hydroxylase superfamily)